MPEGPEVARIVDQLAANIVGRKIEKINFLSGRYVNHSAPQNVSFFLQNSSPIKLISCKGKFIWFEFEGNDWSIWNTLGMTGGWSKTKSDHSRVQFLLSKSGLFEEVYFNDIRNFGTLKFCQTKDELDEKISSLGFDMLRSPPDSQKFLDLLRKNKKKTLPEFLMNQKHICGVGNYIKSESLYLSGISPLRLCNSLSTEESERLRCAIIRVITSSYSSGGSTIRTYSDFYGNTGSFSTRFMVYGNDVDPQGKKIETITTKDGRTTFWVPELQK